jgi:hypothetical protein
MVIYACHACRQHTCSCIAMGLEPHPAVLCRHLAHWPRVPLAATVVVASLSLVMAFRTYTLPTQCLCCFDTRIYACKILLCCVCTRCAVKLMMHRYGASAQQLCSETGVASPFSWCSVHAILVAAGHHAALERCTCCERWINLPLKS